ncbi:MAG TPA: catalase [Steroidobacteraceae bacterium]|jgi:catalase
MAIRKSGSKASHGKSRPMDKSKASARRQSPAARGSTVSGPSRPSPSAGNDLARLAAEQAELAGRMPFNANKAREYAPADPSEPPVGLHEELPSAAGGASTLSEVNDSAKSGAATTEPASLDGSLAPRRVNSAGQALTTNQGVAISSNQDSLKAGLRGPTLLEDFILREKITHFDHERIPERVVHARGSAAHGYFEAYKPLTKLTRATVFAEAGKKTPVFVRFSTVAGERGSTDTARDVRGFAVKFYSDQGNWDLVGNNMPVFFIQDAMKFPDLIHAVKPEPHHQMPQAASAHDTFWDFVSLMPESTHMLLWVMSDRAIPRSYRMMQGFGVHTFRLVNEAGQSTFCKFHWKPKLGTHSLVWDEAVKISGADSDFHRRDLWEAIESGNYPEWEMGIQIFSEADADKFSFDVLDATKLIPEELVPVQPVGRMVLNRNPDNFFAETEQVAFCTAHVIPGIDFSNDPLLHGRIHSYVDTQITRLGGANFHEIPINAPIAPVHNNQRDGIHRQAIARGRVAYEPNSLGGGCPFQAGSAGFVSFPDAIRPNNAPVDKVRGRPEKFAEHYAQATLFFESQSPKEQAHIIGGFRFELSKVTVPEIRKRVVASLRNVSEELASAIAEGLGIDMPDPMPKAIQRRVKPEVTVSKPLSLLALPGDGSIATRKVAILIADGIEGDSVAAVMEAVTAQGAVARLLGSRLGSVSSDSGETFEVDATLENSPSVLFDALVLPDGSEAVDQLARDGRTLEFIKDQYRHCKTILALGASAGLLEGIGIRPQLPDGTDDSGILMSAGGDGLDPRKFIEAIAKHRHLDRDSDPPVI